MANQDQNLNFGWHAQKLGNTAGQSGFSQAANAPAGTSVSSASQVSGGAPFPTPAGITQVLENPGYAASPALMTPGPISAPTIPASGTAQANTTGLPVTVAISGGTVTVVAVAPANSTTFTTQATSSPCTVTVPPGGSIKLTYSVVPTSWGWTPTI